VRVVVFLTFLSGVIFVVAFLVTRLSVEDFVVVRFTVVGRVVLVIVLRELSVRFGAYKVLFRVGDDFVTSVLFSLVLSERTGDETRRSVNVLFSRCRG